MLPGVVVVADLSGPLLALETQFIFHEAVADGAPVVVGIGHVMGVEVTRSATELGCQLALLERLALLLQAIDEHHDLLAQAGRGGRLSMRLGQHGHVFPLLGISAELIDEFL